MSEETKSAAELAREERKERIGKASDSLAEKREKKANQSKTKKLVKWLVPVVIIVIAIALALLYFFGVPHRTISAVKYADGTKVTVAEYEYYYKSVYNNISNTSYQYEQYYSSYYGEGAGQMMTGFDYKKTPKNQECSLTEENTGISLSAYGENPTWADFLREYAMKQAYEINAVYEAASKAGTKLTEENKTSINEQIEQIRSSAAENNYSLNAYLKVTYGRGMNESLLRKLMERQLIASSYISGEDEAMTEAITDEEILAYYNEHQDDYNQVSLRYFTITADVAENTDETDYSEEELAAMTKETYEEKKKVAEEFYEGATLDNFSLLAYAFADEEDKEHFNPESETYNESYTTASNVNRELLETNFDAAVAEWAYDSSRQVGDKYLAEVPDDDGCTSFLVLVIKSLPDKDDTLQPVSVRHILLALTKDEEVTDEEGNTTTEKKEIRTAEEARAEAEALMEEWVRSGAKEEDFITLAAEKSEDTGSADSGGLYEDIYTSSSYAKPFLDWCFEEGRKVGDYGVVDTQYGSHIMYMSAISDKPVWMQNIAETIASEKAEEFYKNIVGDGSTTGAKVSDKLVSRVQDRVEDYAARLVASFNSTTNS